MFLPNGKSLILSLASAAQAGDLPLFKSLLALDLPVNYFYIMCGAVKATVGDGEEAWPLFLHEVHSLIKHAKPNTATIGPDAYMPAIKAAKHGNVEALEWLQSENFLFDILCMQEAAASHGHLCVIKWLVKEDMCDTVPLEILQCAGSLGHFEIIIWAHETKGTRLPDDLLHCALCNGHLPLGTRERLTDP